MNFVVPLHIKRFSTAYPWQGTKGNVLCYLFQFENISLPNHTKTPNILAKECELFLKVFLTFC